MIVGTLHKTNKPGYFILILGRNDEYTVVTLASSEPYFHQKNKYYSQVQDTEGRTWWLVEEFVDVVREQELPEGQVAQIPEDTVLAIVHNPEFIQRMAVAYVARRGETT